MTTKTATAKQHRLTAECIRLGGWMPDGDSRTWSLADGLLPVYFVEGQVLAGADPVPVRISDLAHLAETAAQIAAAPGFTFLHHASTRAAMRIVDTETYVAGRAVLDHVQRRRVPELGATYLWGDNYSSRPAAAEAAEALASTLDGAQIVLAPSWRGAAAIVTESAAVAAIARHAIRWPDPDPISNEWLHAASDEELAEKVEELSRNSVGQRMRRRALGVTS